MSATSTGFSPTREWRFDFAWPDVRAAIEIEGLTRGVPGRRQQVGRHQQVEGYGADCEKYNEATLAGWRVFRVTRKMIGTPHVEIILKQIIDDLATL